LRGHPLTKNLIKKQVKKLEKKGGEGWLYAREKRLKFFNQIELKF
jgi:hypothetical protein